MLSAGLLVCLLRGQVPINDFLLQGYYQSRTAGAWLLQFIGSKPIIVIIIIFFDESINASIIALN